MTINPKILFNPNNLFNLSMNRRQIILFACSAILVIATNSCVYQSGRNSESNNLSANIVNGNQANAPKTNKPDENKKSDDGDFLVEHMAVSNARYAEIDRQIKDEKLIEKAADKLNRSLMLPYDIKLITKDCKEINAFYDSDARSVTVCYELMEHFYNVFRAGGFSEEKSYKKMSDAVRFAFLHEIGHALIDVYNLPITGSEEDAADRCSAFINLTELGEDGVNTVMTAAEAFEIESKNIAPSKRNPADEHLLQEQRFYNSLCMIYGSNTTKYADILEKKKLPRERALKCPQEYERMVDSWKILLAPWRRS